MEILETSAEAWWRLSGIVNQSFIRLETSIPPMDQMAAALGELKREAERLGLRTAAAQIDRLSDFVQGRHGDRCYSLQEFAQRLRPLILDLHLRVLDELRDRFFLAIPSEGIPYYRQNEPLFGREVERAFPNAAEDISEAGKCLALGRSTAAVFHLMRVMEIGVQKLGTKLGITLATEKNWQNILDEVNKAIKALNQKDPVTRAYAEASAHLYNVKLCWRNEVMHPKQTYTPDEARALFTACKTFINDLAGLV